MLVYRSETSATGVSGAEITEYLLTGTDARYRAWWPGTHLGLHTLSRGAGCSHVGDMVRMDEYVGRRRVRMTGVVTEVVPGELIVWQLRRGVRLPVRLTLRLSDRAGGVAIRHTITAGWAGPGRVADPLIRRFFGPGFAAAMDEHVHIEFGLLADRIRAERAGAARDHGLSDDVEAIVFRSGTLQLYGRLRHRSDDAPTVVLLSGLGFHTFEYEPLASRLARTGINALSFDFRGHGRSDGPRGRWTLDELTADCRAALDVAERRAGGPIALFGNSLGAMIAIRCAAEDERPVGVVAANCPAHAGDFLLTGPRRVLYRVLGLVEPVAPLRISVNYFIPYEHLIADPEWVATIRADPLIADARRFAVSTYRDLLDGWDGPLAVQRLHKPILVLQGRHDRMQPPEQSRLVFDAANEPKRFELLDTGHLPHLEAPDVVAARLLSWLATAASLPS